MKSYLRTLSGFSGRCLLNAYKLDGFRGAYVVTCHAFLTKVPLAPRLHSIGLIDHRAELMNYLDNFVMGELRCPEIEDHLQTQTRPVIIDVGINVGVTVRWWLHLNAKAKIIGIDMMQESLEFTTRKLEKWGSTVDWCPICIGVSDTAGVAELVVSDPLDGTTAIDNSVGNIHRSVNLMTMDEVLARRGLDQIDLLKVDIEGHGGKALLGAEKTLAITRYVVFETHNREETRLAQKTLAVAGFALWRVSGRTMWWERSI